MLRVVIATVVTVIAWSSVRAAITPGLLDDFEDGTTGGWGPRVTNVAGGPVGSTRALDIGPGPGQNLGARDRGIAGPLGADVSAILFDMRRDGGDGIGEIELRVVLFAQDGSRWTSATPEVLPANGLWSNYRFGVLESDLTLVNGTGTYAELVADVERVMLRLDSGAPSATGEQDGNPFLIDNVTAVPLPAAGLLLLSALAVARFAARRALSA